jgi:Mg-chelatase subunit ChlD
MAEQGTFSLRALPKPLLFSICGALGGLLGALVLGEPLWALLRPPLSANKARLEVAASPTVALYQGGANRFPVKIARTGFTGPVTLHAADLPAGVTLGDVRIPADRDEAEVRVRADKDARIGSKEVALVGTGPRVETTARVKLAIDRPPPPPPALRLAVSPQVEVTRGGKSRFTVLLARDRFSGPVRLRFEGGGTGLTLPRVTVPAEQARAEVEVSAAADADLGTRTLSVAGQGKAGKATPKARARARLKVKPYEPPPVDVLFLLDLTASMEFAIRGVRDGIIAFAGNLEKSKLDARVGLIGFRDRMWGQEPEILTFDGSVFTRDWASFKAKVGRLYCIGNPDIPESSLDAVALGSRQAFRAQAARVLILITDAPPKVPDKEIKSVAEATSILRDRKINQLHLVIRSADLPYFTPLQTAAGGKFFDIIRAAGGAAFAGELMPAVSREIVRTTIASIPALSAARAPPAPAPAPPAGASLPPRPPAPPALKGVQSSQAFAAGSAGRLLLAISVWTAVSAAAVCLLLVAGQRYYQRRGWPAPPEALKGFGGGLVAGLIGGAAGQLLYQVTGGPLFQLAGWTILGALAGLGLAFFVPNLRPDKGLLGGALGGAAGGLGYLAVGLVLGDAAGRVLGAVILGACIGLMVALAEVMFRSAWLEVQYGPREKGLVNLGPEPVSIGGSARDCTVFAREAAPVALRYWFKNGKVLCEDVPTGAVSEAAVGQPRPVGAVTVTVRTAAAAAPTATAPVAPAPVAPVGFTFPAPPRPPAPVAVNPPRPPAPAAAVPVPPRPPAPVTVNPPRPPAPVPPRPVPPRPPAPVGGTPPVPRPPAPGPPAPARSTPAGDACPGCGRKAPGTPGQRYCMVCDQMF